MQNGIARKHVFIGEPQQTITGDCTRISLSVHSSLASGTVIPVPALFRTVMELVLTVKSLACIEGTGSR